MKLHKLVLKILKKFQTTRKTFEKKEITFWYNVTFNTKTLKLYIGNQEKHFTECKSVKGTFELNKLLELFLTNKKNKNTIQQLL